jgi:hypothetical protein
MADLLNMPIYSYHMRTTNRDFVVDAIQRCLKPYGYFPVPKHGEIPSGCPRHRFYISAVHKGWISIVDNEYFARWELARRSSTYIPGKVVLCWADPGEGWGYQYWDGGVLEAEFVSDLMELHREWFEEEPTDQDVRRFNGNPNKMKEVFGKVGFSLREMEAVYASPPEDSLVALREFGAQIALDNGLLNFEAIDSLSPQERLGKLGFHHIDFYEKYHVDLDDLNAPDEIEFPEDIQTPEQA